MSLCLTIFAMKMTFNYHQGHTSAPEEISTHPGRHEVVPEIELESWTRVPDRVPAVLRRFRTETRTVIYCSRQLSAMIELIPALIPDEACR